LRVAAARPPHPEHSPAPPDVCRGVCLWTAPASAPAHTSGAVGDGHAAGRPGRVAGAAEGALSRLHGLETVCAPCPATQRACGHPSRGAPLGPVVARRAGQLWTVWLSEGHDLDEEWARVTVHLCAAGLGRGRAALSVLGRATAGRRGRAARPAGPGTRRPRAAPQGRGRRRRSTPPAASAVAAALRARGLRGCARVSPVQGRGTRTSLGGPAPGTARGSRPRSGGKPTRRVCPVPCPPPRHAVGPGPGGAAPVSRRDARRVACPPHPAGPPGGVPSPGAATPSPVRTPALRDRARRCHPRRAALRPLTRRLHFSGCPRSTPWSRSRSTPQASPASRDGGARATAWCAARSGRTPSRCAAQGWAHAGGRPGRTACGSKRSRTVGRPQCRTPPPGVGSATRRTGRGR
jgi:hypothetical protein